MDVDRLVGAAQGLLPDLGEELTTGDDLALRGGPSGRAGRTKDGYERLVTGMRDADAEAAAAGADARLRLRAQAEAFYAFVRTQRGVFCLMFGHDAAAFGIPREDHPALALGQQWLDALRACEGEGVRWPDGVEGAATTLWSALLGRFALWSTTFGRQDREELTAFAHRTVDTVLREAVM